jgi:HK97 family phage major capsid protein
MSTLLSLRQALGTAVDDLESLIKGNAKRAEIEAKETEVEDLEKRISSAERNLRRIASGARPLGGTGQERAAPNDDPTRFSSLGEQLKAIARHYATGTTDTRLRAPSGMGETDPSGGGFPVQVDFAQSILTRIYDMGEIAQRVFRVGISTNANGIKIPGIDETSRVTGSRWGGVQAYWLGEGDAITNSKPKFRLIELDLKKLGALWYVTDELMADAGALTGIANEAFAQELTFTLEDSVIRGTGSGMPQGILNSNCLITVPAEKGQATKTVLYQNLLNMWARMWARSRLNAVWFINQDVEPQLYAVNQVIGTAGVPVYLPPGGISEKPYATLFGRPVIPVEYCATLGTPSDIVLADFSQYVVADKNAMQQMSSIHVRFVNDEMTFRLTYRLDGQPIWQAALTPYQGTNTKSPFIVLAAR